MDALIQHFPKLVIFDVLDFIGSEEISDIKKTKVPKMLKENHVKAFGEHIMLSANILFGNVIILTYNKLYVVSSRHQKTYCRFMQLSDDDRLLDANLWFINRVLQATVCTSVQVMKIAAILKLDNVSFDICSNLDPIQCILSSEHVANQWITQLNALNTKIIILPLNLLKKKTITYFCCATFCAR
eukprot:203491_1